MTMLHLTPWLERHPGLLAGALLAGALMHAGHALAQPAQRPLLADTTMVRPNLMVSLDTSGSMAQPFPDSYRITQNRTSGGLYAAQRSAEVNPLYYNPRITYQPRVGSDGLVLPSTDGVAFISNQTSTTYAYRVYATSAEALLNSPPIVIRHSSFSPQPGIPSGWVSVAEEDNSNYAPVHLAYQASQLNASTPGFSYAICSAVGADNGSQSCTSYRLVTLRHDDASSVNLPTPHSRTDCSGNVCTAERERANVMNWYRYYLTRMAATQTAMGLAFNDPRLDNRLRVGYLRTNFPKVGIPYTPGVDVNLPHLLRGVRNWSTSGASNRQFYDWLYGNVPMGVTPLHNAFDKVASYLRVPQAATENPWAENPAALHSSGNREMSCRRSYHMVFSDGAWSTSHATNTGANHDNTAGPEFTRRDQNGNLIASLAYNPQGDSTQRKRYLPFPSTGTGGLADLAARYHWHEDFRPDLSNDITTSAGRPTFWQNMTSYTIGYLIKPSGEYPSATSGLTFNQIDHYAFGYVANGFAGATRPSWPTGALASATETRRVDDFIQAGFTGGGRGFSVESADDIRSVINAVLSDILSANGDDAGVELGSTDDPTTGQLKYLVDYRTVDNSGNVTAQRLGNDGHPLVLTQDAAGHTLNPPGTTYWSAAALLLPHNERRVFSLRANQTAFDFNGTIESLPTEVQSALRQRDSQALVPAGNPFINYVRGLDPVRNSQGAMLRLRLNPMGAIVNSTPLFVGADQDLAYDLLGSVDGRTSYAAHLDRLRAAPESLLVATNAGMVHQLDAATGRELAAYVPRRVMSRLIGNADPATEFSYLLDGPLSLHDVFSAGQWQQTATGTGGRGERLIYALRIPVNGQQPRAMQASDLLWEVGPDTVDNASVALGHLTNPLRSGQTVGGTWALITTTGHHNGQNDGSRHGLVVLDPTTGAVIRSVALPANASAGRGLGGVTLVRDRNLRIVAAYAGDANGHLWRFDLRGAPQDWRVSYNQPVFTTAGNRPIFGAPAWQPHPRGGTMVVIATGIALDETDLGDIASNESMYGIWDPTPVGEPDVAGFSTVQATQLLTQGVEALVHTTIDGRAYHSTTRHTIDWAQHRGWTFALGHPHAGERAIDQVRNLASSVLINTTVINRAGSRSESCSASRPANLLYMLNALDGAGRPAFDIDGDGRLEPVSMVYLPAGGFNANVGVVFRNADHSIARDFMSQLNAGLLGEAPAVATPARHVRATITGTGARPENTGVDPQGPRPWSRQQYQLSRTPQ
jgi:type IV pilus assembly protein PilY1